MKLKRYGQILHGEVGIFGMVITEVDGIVSLDSKLSDEFPTGPDDNPELALQISSFVHAVESIILAHHCAGLDVSNPKYLNGIFSAVEQFSNHLD